MYMGCTTNGTPEIGQGVQLEYTLFLPDVPPGVHRIPHPSVRCTTILYRSLWVHCRCSIPSSSCTPGLALGVYIALACCVKIHSEEVKLNHALRNINSRHFLPITKGFSNMTQWDFATSQQILFRTSFSTMILFTSLFHTSR